MNLSPLSTACTSPINDSIADVIKNDAVRYRKKGFGLIVAIVIACCYFYFTPIILKSFWPTFNSKHEVDMFYLIVTMCIHTGVYAFANLIMYWIYISKIPFFEKYKVLNKPWPWEKNPQKWRILLKKTFKTLFIVHFVLLPITISVDILLGYKFRVGVDTFPSHLEIIKQMIFLMLTEDFMFYWSHRILHWKKIYPYIHKIHHEYSVSISLCAEYAHPLEWVFGNLLPTNLGFKLLGHNIHYATYLIWMTLRLMETVDGHCGYEFSWSPYRLLPLSSMNFSMIAANKFFVIIGSSTYHNFHHSHNIGNFSSFFTFWDTICGTNKSYYSDLAKREKENLLGEMGKADKVKAKPKHNQHLKKCLKS